MKFLVAWEKGKKKLLKIELDDKQQVWAETSVAVFNYAKNNFAEGEEAGFEYTEKNGQYKVTRINKNGESKKVTSSPTETSEYVCEDCGTKLKEGKYKKCYTCNKKNPTKTKSSSKKYGDLSTEEQNRRASLTAMASACEAIKVLTGQITDVETIATMVETLYERFYKKLTE